MRYQMNWLKRLLTFKPFEQRAVPELAVASGAINTAANAALAEESAEAVALHTLTPREREVFELIVQGKMLKEAAAILGIKYSTVNTHYTNMYRKLGVQSRAECILRYYMAR